MKKTFPIVVNSGYDYIMVNGEKFIKERDVKYLFEMQYSLEEVITSLKKATDTFTTLNNSKENYEK
jgi:hypothetical protein